MRPRGVGGSAGMRFTVLAGGVLTLFIAAIVADMPAMLDEDFDDIDEEETGKSCDASFTINTRHSENTEDTREPQPFTQCGMRCFVCDSADAQLPAPPECSINPS